MGELGQLRASRGYRFEAIAVILGPAAPDIAVRRLWDLKGLPLTVDNEGTLGDTILMLSGAGTLTPNLTHVRRLDGVFAGMERGEYAATLVELTRFDAYVARHPDTRLKSSGYYHTIGFNVGIVGLARNAPLMDQVDEAIAALVGSGEFAAIAQAARVTYLPPREPDVRSAITAADLRKD